MKPTIFKRNFFWYGIYYGIASILIFLIEYFLVPKLLTNKIASTLISLLPLIIFICLAALAERKENGGYLTFGNTFKSMFFTALIGIIIFSVFSYFFNKYYAPEYMTEIFEKEMTTMRIKLEDQGKSDEEIDKIMKMTESVFKMQNTIIFKFLGVVFLSGFAAIIALLSALFIRKNPPFNNFSEPPLKESEA